MITDSDTDPLDERSHGLYYDTLGYEQLLTGQPYPPEIEAAISVVSGCYRRRHQARITYLSGHRKELPQRGKPGKPGGEIRSNTWREADAGLFAALSTLAAVLGVLYPAPGGQPPIDAVKTLIEHRVGPLCTGWSSNNNGQIDTHHPLDTCPIHPREEQP